MKINYKLVLSCVLFMITPFRTMATEYLIVEFKDKSFVTFGMDKQPVISFKGGKRSGSSKLQSRFARLCEY